MIRKRMEARVLEIEGLSALASESEWTRKLQKKRG